MVSLELFPKPQIVGVFRGFREGGLEFHADLVLPYRNEFQSTPMHGQFLLVQLESADEAVLGRIASFSSEGRLASGSGEEFNIRAVREGRDVPEDLREQYLKYKVNIRVLGVLRRVNDAALVFVASHRRLPHVGSAVAYPSGDVLREIAGHHQEGAEIGHFALGEYIYGQRSAAEKKHAGLPPELTPLDWMQVRGPEVLVRFPVESLVSRRSFIFARAGFGKSNLNKLLFSRLYRTTPTVEKAGGRRVPVGTILFDPDGEYFWPDDKGRPGLCDVPELRDQLVVFTARRSPSAFYQAFVAGSIRLDIRRLNPADVIAIGLSPDKQGQQNVNKLRGLSATKWTQLVDAIAEHGHGTPLETITALLGLDAAGKQEAEALAARSNMTTIVAMIHDKSSLLMDMLLAALAEGKLCVVDVSQLRGAQAMVLSGLILRKIFDHNQAEFTKAAPATIPTIAVVEEAQTVLREQATSAEPYIAWVKEGRKYDLGALLITQQPGSIPPEILSQGDNWFIFHLLSSADLKALATANAHFSQDLLGSLLNEPIPGQGVFWSSVGGKPYPIALRALSFEALYQAQDPDYDRAAERTYAETLRARFQHVLHPGAPQASRAGAAAVPVAAGSSPRRGSSQERAGNGHRAATTHRRGQGAAAKPEQGGSELLLFSAETTDGAPAGGADPTPEAQAQEGGVDVLATLEARAIEALRQNTEMGLRLRGDGVAWGALKAFFKNLLPATIHDADQMAFNLVPKALEQLFGTRNQGGWHTFKSAQGTTWVKTGVEPPRDAPEEADGR